MSASQHTINPATLTPLELYTDRFPITVNLAYATADNFMKEAIYKDDARLWLQEDLATVVLLAALIAKNKFNAGFVLFDGLRTTTAQQAMLETQALKDNPHWLADKTRVLSSPGGGGHPRAWAVDLALTDKSGALMPMGTDFDELPLDGNGPDVNRAHRDYTVLTANIRQNRKNLEYCMMTAAYILDFPLWPLPVEWWDFRIDPTLANKYMALSDEDLPPAQRMTNRIPPDQGAYKENFPRSHYRAQKERLTKGAMSLYKTAYG